MGIYIQKIRTYWTKISRGYPGAHSRNQVPERFPMDIPFKSKQEIYLQEIQVEEGTFHRPTIKPPRPVNLIQVRELRLELEVVDHKLHIAFWQETEIRKNLGTLPINAWCQVKSNRRFALDYTWAYHKNVYNIFYGALSKAEDISRSREPVFIQDFQSLLK